MWSLHRHTYHPRWTIGSLYHMHKFMCWTLEDGIRLDMGYPKEPGKTAIPTGIYEVALTHSTRFDAVLPILLKVPYFTGIRMHAGNYPRNSDGCILCGTKAVTGFIEQSKTALEKVVTEMLLPNNGIRLHVWNSAVPFDVAKKMEEEWSC